MEQKRTGTWKNLKRAWSFARKHKTKFFLYCFSTLLLSLISALTPMLSAKELLNLTNSLWQQLISVAIIIFIVEITRNIARYFSDKIGQIFFRETILALQVAVAQESLKLETKEIDSHSSGIFIERLNKDTNDIVNIFLNLNNAIMDVVTELGVLVMIFVINPLIATYFIIVTIILFVLEKIRIKKRYEINKKVREIQDKNSGIITEMIRGLRDIKVLNEENNFMYRMEQQLSEANRGRYKMSEVDRRYRLGIGSLHDIFDLLFVFLGIFLVSKNMLSAASFLLLYMYSSRMYNILNYTAVVIEQLKNFSISAERVFEIIENEKFAKEHFGEKHLPHIHGDFEFDHVTFSYNDKQEILKDISFQIHANETVSFVGKSGGGKTTIFSLLTKLYTPQQGTIRIDGYDIQTLDKSSIRDNISIITQNPYIFNFSIRDNLKLTNQNISDEEIIKACKTACFHDFVMTLTNKYDTIVGEGGITLSGGQRQRLAIARALLKKTEIILFDEATSALDNETQQNIQDAIHNMKGEYTILIIAHRLSTVIDSDRIILIEEGQNIAEGNHETLMNENLFYRHLYQKELQ